jgi:hypothetical protein
VTSDQQGRPNKYLTPKRTSAEMPASSLLVLRVSCRVTRIYTAKGLNIVVPDFSTLSFTAGSNLVFALRNLIFFCLSNEELFRFLSFFSFKEMSKIEKLNLSSGAYHS